MSEWKSVFVEDLKKDSPNALSTGPFGSSISSKYFVDNGVPVIRGGNLSANISHRLIEEGLVFVSHQKAEEFERSIVRVGDLIFTCWGTINQIGFIDGKGSYKEYIISNKQMKLTTDPQKADSLFLYYLFSSPDFQQRILNNNIGSSVPGFNLGQLKRMEITIPPLPEQRAIAAILSSLDDKIDLLHRQNATLEAMAEAVFRQWFVVEAREEWGEGTLGDLVEFNYGKTLRDSERSGGGYPVYGSSGIVGYHSEYYVSGPGIITGRKGTLGVINYSFDNFFPIDTTFYITSKRDSQGLFFEYCLLKTQNLTEMNSDSAVPGLNRNLAHGIQLLIPPKELADEFNLIAEPIFLKIRYNQTQIHTLTALRDTLLPKLMSGEVRVKM